MPQFSIKTTDSIESVKSTLTSYIASLTGKNAPRDVQKYALAKHLKDLLDGTVSVFDAEQKKFAETVAKKGDLYGFYQYTVQHLATKTNSVVADQPVKSVFTTQILVTPAKENDKKPPSITTTPNIPVLTPVSKLSDSDQQYTHLDSLSIPSAFIDPLEQFINQLKNYKNSRVNDERGDYYTRFMTCIQFSKQHKVNAVAALLATLSPPAEANTNAVAALTRTLFNPFNNKGLGKIVGAFLVNNPTLLNSNQEAKKLLRIK